MTRNPDQTADTSTVRELMDEVARLKGKLSARSRTLVKLRDKIILITDHIVEEGDATYFGSTNDADELISLKDALENWAWTDIMKDAKPDDPYEACRVANERIATLTARIEQLEAATERERERCAKIAENVFPDGKLKSQNAAFCAGNMIAAAIRKGTE